MAEEKKEEAAEVPAEDIGDFDDLVSVCALSSRRKSI